MPNLSDKLKSLGVKVGARDLTPPVPHDAWPIARVMPGQVYATPAGETYLVEASYPSPFNPGLQTADISSDAAGILPSMEIIAAWAGESRLQTNPLPAFAFLDIETTGFYPVHNEITVVGIYLTQGVSGRFIQLVGNKITGDAILESLQGTANLYTYNGHRFDLPFIRARHGVNLEVEFKHCDLIHHCWKNNLYGGLKKVEICLGIARQVKEVDGYEAVKLWWRYVEYGDYIALRKLLDYNKEDVVNLKTLKERLLPEL